MKYKNLSVSELIMILTFSKTASGDFSPRDCVLGENYALQESIYWTLTKLE